MISHTASKSGSGNIWGRDVQGTWSIAVIFSVLPAIVLGVAIVPMGFLMVSMIVFIPAALIQGLINRQTWAKNGVRFAIIMVTSLLSLTYVSLLDKQIPSNAEPITRGIEAYKLANGRYPDSIEALIPQHLELVPSLKFALLQPPIRLRNTDGVLKLTIESSSGDAFAHYEYDFQTRTWQHNS